MWHDSREDRYGNNVTWLSVARRRLPPGGLDLTVSRFYSTSGHTGDDGSPPVKRAGPLHRARGATASAGAHPRSAFFSPPERFFLFVLFFFYFHFSLSLALSSSFVDDRYSSTRGLSRTRLLFIPSLYIPVFFCFLQKIPGQDDQSPLLYRRAEPTSPRSNSYAYTPAKCLLVSI